MTHNHKVYVKSHNSPYFNGEAACGKRFNQKHLFKLHIKTCVKCIGDIGKKPNIQTGTIWNKPK